MRSSRASARRVRLGFKRLSLGLAGLSEIERETMRDVLRVEADRPMRGGSADMAHTSLFGDAMLQKELF